MKKTRFPRVTSAFTLVELLVVISIIAVLAGMTLAGVTAAMTAAKKVQAKNDMAQICNAVTAYYTEYGRYPSAGTSGTSDLVFGVSSLDNSNLINVLRYPSGWTDSNSENTRQIQFIQPKISDMPATTATKGTVNKNSGKWYDPWGTEYVIFVDNDYDGTITVSRYLSNLTDNPPFNVGAASVGYYYRSSQGTIPQEISTVTTSGVLGKKSVLLSWQ